MALAFTLKDSNENTAAEPTVTDSITWAAGCRGIVCVGTSTVGSASFLDPAIAVVGGGVNWIKVPNHVPYRLRRCLAILISDGTPANGTLQINITSNQTWESDMYAAIQVTGFDETTPYEPGQSNSTGDNAGNSPLTLPSLGTIDAGDQAFVMGCTEGGNVGIGLSPGVTQISKQENGAGVRSLITGYTASSNTPSLTWSGSTGAAVAGCIFNISGAPPPPSGSMPVIRQQYERHL